MPCEDLLACQIGLVQEELDFFFGERERISSGYTVAHLFFVFFFYLIFSQLVCKNFLVLNLKKLFLKY